MTLVCTDCQKVLFDKVSGEFRPLYERERDNLCRDCAIKAGIEEAKLEPHRFEVNYRLGPKEGSMYYSAPNSATALDKFHRDWRRIWPDVIVAECRQMD